MSQAPKYKSAKLETCLDPKIKSTKLSYYKRKKVPKSIKPNPNTKKTIQIQILPLSQLSSNRGKTGSPCLTNHGIRGRSPICFYVVSRHISGKRNKASKL
ncbi:unnamed protein product [Cuscuta epithymum]|uniref:Uncharacterized protein n=1 Tax=Cuscuta epithymum TaxID=186058 RepID=A0AAV0G1G3_9ASTE|nr:unnamed protein product [Cuscuta epithymum]